MSSVPFKIAVCLAGGFLFVVSGCGQTATLPNNANNNEGEATVKGETKVDPLAPATPPDTTLTSAERIASSTTSAPTATSSATPTLEPLPIPTLNGPPYTYHTIQSGETLGYLAWQYGLTIEALVAMNNLPGPEAIIQVDQQVRVPIEVETIAPAERLLPDSEVVYGPNYVAFDIAAFLEEQGGYLADYEAYVGGKQMSGAAIVERVATQFSVGPRLLLALVEYYGQWVSFS